jgi:DNA-binding response OmpR family regulator
VGKVNKFKGVGMLSIVLVTLEPNNFLELAKQLKTNPQVQISFVKTKAEAIKIVSTANPALMILDAQPDDLSVFQIVRDLIMVNAGISIAVVSQMPEKEFETASEGLGILAQLKPNPGRSEAQMLISKLKILKTLF